MRRRKPQPGMVGFDELVAVMNDGRISADQVPLVLASHRFDLDGTTRFAEALASAILSRHADLSPKRQRALFAAGRGVAIAAIAATLEAVRDR